MVCVTLTVLGCTAAHQPVTLATVNEGTTLIITASFVDQDGALIFPNEGALYRIDDVDTGTPIVSLRPIPGPLAQEMDIEVTRQQQGAHGNTKRLMRRRLTVIYTYGDEGSPIAGGTAEVDWLVKNLTNYP